MVSELLFRDGDQVHKCLEAWMEGFSCRLRGLASGQVRNLRGEGLPNGGEGGLVDGQGVERAGQGG